MVTVLPTLLINKVPVVSTLRKKCKSGLIFLAIPSRWLSDEGLLCSKTCQTVLKAFSWKPKILLPFIYAS